MTRYYLGVDAGGTKTNCLVSDETGRVLGFGRAGTGNYEGYGVAAAYKEIEKAINGALGAAKLSLDDISGVGLAIAGADLPEDYEMLERELFTPMLGEKPRVFRNDSMGGLRGGTRDPFGIVIACGTGCVCAGKNRSGAEKRVGGINEDFGDKVSGSSIGTEGLKAVWRARDGITAPTLLTELFLTRAGLDDVDAFFSAMYHGRVKVEALEPMAPLVFDAALRGDAAACGILEWGGEYLGEMVCAVARKLNMQEEVFDVVMAGSVFKGSSPVLIDRMRARIHRECPQARTVMPVYEPVVGALLLGMELELKIDARIYEQLDKTLAEDLKH